MPALKRFLFAAVLLGTAVSCSKVKREQLLVQQANEYHMNLRWKRLEHASNRVVPWKQEAFLSAYKARQETLQIEEHEFSRVEFPKPGEEGYESEPTMATVKVVRYQYELPSVTRQKVELEEKWLYHKGGWFLYGGFAAKNAPSR